MPEARGPTSGWPRGRAHLSSQPGDTDDPTRSIARRDLPGLASSPLDSRHPALTRSWTSRGYVASTCLGAARRYTSERPPPLAHGISRDATRACWACSSRGRSRLLRGFVGFVEGERRRIPYRRARDALGGPAQRRPARHTCPLARDRSRARDLASGDGTEDAGSKRGAFPPRLHHRPEPYVYTDVETADLMMAAGQLRSTTGLHGATFKTAIGLLAAKGLRPGEANKLDVKPL